MPNEFDKSGMIHQWIYVIIPVKESEDSLYNKYPPTFPLFCAFCKVCRSYFTESMDFGKTAGGTISSSSLPRYGCMPPDDIPVI
jgi:hypothetical protein